MVMQYPTALRYAETILNPEGLFRSLSGLVASDPLEYSSGSFGVVFRVRVEGVPYALKCFTRHQPGRAEAYRRMERALAPCWERGASYVVPFRWLEEEMTVFGEDDRVMQQSAVLMEWVEGRSLTEVLAEAIAARDRERLAGVAEAFDRMALWLLEQPFAHGDLKPDNVMVREDGTLVLVDYDGLYLPEMAGERAREVGTVGFRHPGRTEGTFGKHIDDFSIALMSLGLRAVAQWPELYEQYGEGTTLLFDPALLASGTCPAYQWLADTPLAEDPLYAMLGSGNEELPALREALRRHLPDAEQTAARLEAYGYVGEAGAEGLRLVRQEGRYGFVTADGACVVPCRYDRVREFSEGVAAVCLNGLWGFIGTHGEWFCEPQYDDCGDFSEGVAPVSVGGRWSYVGRDFRLLSRPRFDDAWPMAEGRGLVRRGARYGYVGADGRMVIAARYDFAQGFREGVACVMVDGLYGYIDRRGRYVVEPQFDYAQSRRDGRAYVERDGVGQEWIF